MSEAVTTYGELAERLRRITALRQVARLLTWDQETQMPPKGAAQRAEQAAAVAAALHALASDPRLADLAETVVATDAAARVNLSEAAWLHRRAVRVPAALAAALARTTVEAQVAWEAARAAASFADFAPHLARVLALTREKAACLADAGDDGYDALIDEYERGATAEQLASMFGRLRPGLVDLGARIAERGPRPPRLEGHFPRAEQLGLARRLGDVFGYDWAAGRLDLAAHPSSAGSGGDVRITTRVDEADPRQCLYATMHELGHAVYEQGLDPALAMLPAGAHASMGVHEAQSRLFENHLGRSRAFCRWLHGAMTDAFGRAGTGSAEQLWRAVNAVEAGFIRTDADEVHYDLHVMLRFDLERALIGGNLQVGDLEAAWNDRVRADFGRAVPDARAGVLQDVHWSAGIFGYFPTYTLGNVYAAAIHAALRRDLPDLDRQLAAGELGAVLGWLRERIHRRGRLSSPRTLVAEACGRTPDEAALLGYLEAKYAELYGL